MNGKIKGYLDYLLQGQSISLRGWIVLFIVLVYIIVMVNFEHPFGDHVEKIPQHHWLLSGLGCVCIVIYGFYYRFFPTVFKNIFKVRELSFLHKVITVILFTFFMLGANVVYVLLMIPPPDFTTQNLWHIAYFTVAFNSVPIIALNSSQKYYFNKIKTEIKEETSQGEPQQPVESTPVDLRAMKGRIYQSDMICLVLK